jgi:alpha-glucosidase
LVWTGDNDSCWEHLADSVQMLLNLSLSGVAFCGADVGGFHLSTTGELLARWTQLAAFTPFFRNHSNIGTIDQEPWAFGPRVEAICRRYIGLRYQLLPYLYSLFVDAHRRGTPIIRPLFWHYQNDPIATAVDDQFMLGPELLIAPILRQGATARSLYLPAGIWFDFWTGEALRGGRHVLAAANLETLPIFVRAGAILPMISASQYVDQKRNAVVNLHIWPGGGGELSWYEDDGKSLDYLSGAFYQRPISIAVKKRISQLRFGAVEGKVQSDVKRWRVLLRSVSRPARVKAGSNVEEARFDRELGVCAFEIPNQPDAFEVQWR